MPTDPPTPDPSLKLREDLAHELALGIVSHDAAWRAVRGGDFERAARLLDGVKLHATKARKRLRGAGVA